MAARPRSLGKLSALVAAAIALASLLPDTALAASRICRQLEAELASAGRPAPPSRRNEAAIARQQEQLGRAKARARDSGCGFRLFGGSSNSCGAINLKIDQMERNLDVLERRGTRTASAGRSRSQIMAALKANGCRDEAVAERRLPRGLEGTRNLLDQIFGGGIPPRNSLDELGEPGFSRNEQERHIRRLPQQPEGGWVNDDGHIRYSAPPGRYRTLCVRTCDGYYFPMSSASAPSDFDRDQANCQSSCPGSEVQIYYHRQGLESDAMLSGLSGAPYADLPTAWLYKQTGVPSPAGCTCGAQRTDQALNYSVIGGNPPEPPAPEAEPATPYPTARPDPAADPETLANLHGGLDAEALKRMAVTPKINTTKLSPEERKVRVVGPVFLPDPEAAIDLRVPAPRQVR
jgi:hypothetical protein